MNGARLTGALGVLAGETVAVAGCGGKTSLILRLAAEWRERRVLIVPTTKMGRYQLADCDYLYTEPAQWRSPRPYTGIHAAGATVPGRSKLSALPDPELEQLRRQFDLTLLEADGSRNLPFKGWRADEPVVPAFTDRTVGVAVLWAAGQPLGPDIAFQPELFAQISGAALREPITVAHIAKAIAHPEGLFRNARGRRVLFLNQVEGSAALDSARALCRLLPDTFVRTLDAVVAGSLREDLYWNL